MNINQWPDEDRAAYDAAFAEAASHGESTGDRINYVREVLHSAAEDGHLWAQWAINQAETDGLNRQLTAYLQREKRNFLVDLNGTIASKPTVGGTRRRNAEGKTVHTQTLYDVMTLDQLIIHRDALMRDRHGLTERITMTDRLISICQTANEVLGITGDDPQAMDMHPQLAAEVLDTTVDEWLLAPPAQ